MQNTLPDNPADARDMNRGRDVLKTTAHTPEPRMVFGTHGTLLLELGNQTETVFEHVNGKRGLLLASKVADRYNACAGMADPAATIEALRGALELGLEWSDDGSLDSDRSAAELDFIDAARSALALCARDGKGGAK